MDDAVRSGRIIEAHRKVDAHINKLLVDFYAEHDDATPYSVALIDTVLRPYAKILASAHIDKVNPDEIAGMVEMTCAYMVTRLLRHTIPADQQLVALETGGAILENIADAIGETCLQEFTPTTKKVILPN